jgi:hypothetical protein
VQVICIKCLTVFLSEKWVIKRMANLRLCRGSVATSVPNENNCEIKSDIINVFKLEP